MRSLALLLLLNFSYCLVEGQSFKPVRIGIARLTHTHVHWILGDKREEFEIVGIAEPNKELAMRYITQHGLSTKLWFPSLEEMISKTNPEAVTAFGSIDEHLEVVRKCAPKNIHVMVEKPLAISLADAKEMASLAQRYHILLLTNYETTWYPSNHRAFDLVHDADTLGPIRKIVVHDGHPGPKEIGVNQEFLEWLTDPKKNGGGAITDFGCYGANLITWLMKGERPESVMAITQQIKPDIYPNVDDEATIILTYKKTQGIIQASWNWPYNRKDMEVYGTKGFIIADKNGLDIQIGEQNKNSIPTEKLPPPFDNPFAYMSGIIRGTVKPSENDLSSLNINFIAMEILEAAIQSAKTGKRIFLNKK